jgi:DNA gyrase/topoisomerase IV subunit B
VLDQPFTFERDDEEGRLELALTWTEATETLIHSFVNGIPTADGGTHEQGLREAVGQGAAAYIETHD